MNARQHVSLWVVWPVDQVVDSTVIELNDAMGVNISTRGVYFTIILSLSTSKEENFANEITKCYILLKYFGRLLRLSFYLGNLALCLGGRLRHEVNQIYQ